MLFRSTAGRNAGINYGGGLQGADLNYYNGTIEEMKTFFSVTDTPVIPPVDPIDPKPPQPISDVVTISVSGVNVRSGAGTSFPRTSGLYYGNKVIILEYSVQGNNIWGRFVDGWFALLYNGVYYTDKRDFLSITSTVEQPTLPVESNLYIFSTESYWKRPGNGPLVTPTYTDTKTSTGKEVTLGKEWVDYFKRTNTQSTIAYDRIIAPNWGPSKGINSNGKLIYNTLVYPGRNIVKVTEKLTGKDGQQ